MWILIVASAYYNPQPLAHMNKFEDCSKAAAYIHVSPLFQEHPRVWCVPKGGRISPANEL